MADETQQTEGRRRPMLDPRLERAERRPTALERAAAWSGWAAALGLVVLLFWLAVTRSLGLGPKIVLGATVALAAFWVVVHWQSLRASAATRGVRLGTNSVAFVVFVLGCLVLVNYIAARHHWRKDLTEEKRFSLSDQTREVVQGLEQDVTIIAFVGPETSAEVRDRLREYNMLSPKLKLETYDPMTDREKVEEYNVMSPGTLVIKSGARQEKVIGGDEEQITSAILAVTSGEKTRIYFLTGHGERSIKDQSPRGLGNIKANLENQQYQVEELNLRLGEKPQVPPECAVLAIVGPTEPITKEEMAAIAAYAEQGGNLLVALEPGGPDLAQLLKPYGITPLQGTVQDPEWRLGRSPSVFLVADYSKHQITERLPQIGVAMATARAFEVEDQSMMQDPMAPEMPPESTKALPLLKTGAAAWAEQTPTGEPARDPGEPGGPLTIAALYDGSATPPNPYGMTPPPADENAPRMVVLGDADMLTDEFFQAGLAGNLYLGLNSLNWLVANEKLISIPPKDDVPRFLTMNDRQQKLVWVIVVGIIPLTIGLAGLLVWWRRR
ncbi:MAG: GldG family protein [Armatimonadota bacterium]